MSDLEWSIKNGDIDAVRETVEKESVDVNQEISNGRYPLHFAADYGQYEVLKYLIEKKADVNVIDKHGISPLLAAIWEGHTKCVELLLANGANKTGKTPTGQNYIEVAEKDEIRRLLM